jgi:hypothetical protein
MDRDDDNQSLRRIAARLLHKDEREGLRELDQIATGIDAHVRWRFIICAGLFGTSSILAGIGLIVWVVSAFAGQRTGYTPLWIVGPLGAIAVGVLLYWRAFQYRIGPVRTPRIAIYANADRGSVDALEKLFTFLQSELSPKAYYRQSDGTKRYLDYRYFYGRLRGLLLSDDASVRTGCLPPGGFWFSDKIKIEADPEQLLKAINTKPKSGGRPKTYDEAAMLLALIEHPALASISRGDYGSESRLMTLIRDACQAEDDSGTDVAVPEETKLREFAKKILKRIDENRGRQK